MFFLETVKKEPLLIFDDNITRDICSQRSQKRFIESKHEEFQNKTTNIFTVKSSEIKRKLNYKMNSFHVKCVHLLP